MKQNDARGSFIMKNKEKKIWITGASSGIGRALALAYAGQGASLILSGRNAAELNALQKECQQLNAKAEILCFDVKDIGTANERVAEAWKFYDGIDIMVNNAGMSQRSLISETPIAVDREIMEVDYFSKVALTKALLPYWEQQGSGHMVVISSIAGKFGFPQRSAYSAAKHALLGFFETLRLETIHIPIYVTNVCPGRIRTNISLNAINAKGEKHGQMDYGQEVGMTAEQCAREIINAVQKKKKEVYIGGKELLMVYFRRYVPSLFYYLITKVKAN